MSPQGGTEPAREERLLRLLAVSIAAPYGESSPLDAALHGLADLLQATLLVFALQEVGTRRVLYSRRVQRGELPAPAPPPGDSAGFGRRRPPLHVFPLADRAHRVLIGVEHLDERDRPLLAALAPGLAAAAWGERQRPERGDALVAGVTLDCVPFGVAVVNARCQIALRNRAADRALAVGPELRDLDGRLVAGDPVVDARLRELVRSALEEGAEGGGAMLVPRRGQRPLSLVVAPLMPPFHLHFQPRERAIVFLSDPDEGAEELRETLRRHYGLTPTQARVALAVVQGKPVDQIASELGITPLTARSHLKNLFGRMGTSRQAELVAAILSGPVRLLMR